MAQMDWEKERLRLTSSYSRMEDGELQQLAGDADSLTDIARETLEAELSRRGLQSLPPKAASGSVIETKKQPPAPVVIRRFRDMPGASIAQSILESAGIESFLADENVVRMDWLWSNGVGGIKLLVREEDVEAANSLLDQGVLDKFDIEGADENSSTPPE